MDFSDYGLGELVYIVTHGHTPGHISLLHAPSRTMLAGDVFSFIKPSLRRAQEGDAEDKRVRVGREWAAARVPRPDARVAPPI